MTLHLASKDGSQITLSVLGSAQEIEDSEDTSFRLSHADAELGLRLLNSA